MKVVFKCPACSREPWPANLIGGSSEQWMCSKCKAAGRVVGDVVGELEKLAEGRTARLTG